MRFPSLAAALPTALTIALLAACGAPAPGDRGGAAPQAAANRVLTRALGADPDSLDPQRARSHEAFTVLRDVCEPLVEVDARGAIVPAAAKSWKIAADGRSYEFTLRDDLRWSDGSTVTAADFVRAFRRLADPATAAPSEQLFGRIVGWHDVQQRKAQAATIGVHADDRVRLTIELDTPVPYLLSLLSLPSACPYPEGVGADDRSMRWNGAFAVKERRIGRAISLARNVHYSGAAPTNLSAVEYVVTEDARVQLRAYRVGELHVTSTVPATSLADAKRDFAHQLHVVPSAAVYYFGFNLRRGPLATSRTLRRALDMSIDREALADALLQGAAVPAYRWVPEAAAGDSRSVASPVVPWRILTRPDRLRTAQRLYAEAGYSPQKPLHFELLYGAGETHRRVALAVTSMWKESLGADVTPVQVEFATLLDRVGRGDFDAYRSGWAGDYDDPSAFLDQFRSGSAGNQIGFASHEFDVLLTRAESELDVAKRRELLTRAEQLILDESAIVPVYFPVSLRLVSPRVQGWADNALGIVYSKNLRLE